MNRQSVIQFSILGVLGMILVISGYLCTAHVYGNPPVTTTYHLSSGDVTTTPSDSATTINYTDLTQEQQQMSLAAMTNESVSYTYNATEPRPAKIFVPNSNDTHVALNITGNYVDITTETTEKSVFVYRLKLYGSIAIGLLGGLLSLLSIGRL